MVTKMAERLTFEGNFCEIARCRETRWGKHCPDGACSQRKVWERLKEYEDALSADVAPVQHGRWQYNTDFYFWCCSECGENPHKGTGVVTTAEKLPACCPHCGARMDGAE